MQAMCPCQCLDCVLAGMILLQPSICLSHGTTSCLVMCMVPMHHCLQANERAPELRRSNGSLNERMPVRQSPASSETPSLAANEGSVTLLLQVCRSFQTAGSQVLSAGLCRADLHLPACGASFTSALVP